MAFQDQQGSSSSSSLRSVSMGSPETTALLSTISAATPSSYYDTSQAFRPITMPPSSSGFGPMYNPIFYQQAASMHDQPCSFSFHNPPHYPMEAENAVMTNAILAVLSASPSALRHSSTPYFDPLAALEGASSSRSGSRSAFTRFSTDFLPPTTTQRSPSRVSAFKRIISYTFKSLHLKRLQEMKNEQSGGGKRPTSSQLHHMISERKRRVKMNESFDALRALLPPGTKKHKALVLNGAIDYLTSLQAQVSELSLRNLRLEAQLLPRSSSSGGAESLSSSSGGAESRLVDIQINNVSESTSNDDRLVDVRVTVRGEINMLSAVTRVAEFFSRVNSFSLMSMDAETLLVADSSAPSNHMFFRLRIEGSVWDEPAFREALRRIVSDVAPTQP
uniref:BHLH domain-containing protein n=1 Tax=Kalanchoe fedtschenkoi TaxID=63787 RepID=A0A7N0TP21_KALFE